LSLRQLDRLVKEGKLKKVKLSDSRSGIPSEDLERYLREQQGERKARPQVCIVSLPDGQYAAAFCCTVIFVDKDKEVDLVFPQSSRAFEDAVQELEVLADTVERNLKKMLKKAGCCRFS
jgi:hypothetical protein